MNGFSFTAMEFAACAFALSRRNLPFVEFAGEFCGLAAVSELHDAAILHLFRLWANYQRTMDLPDTTGLCWREGIYRCLGSYRSRVETSPRVSPLAPPSSSSSPLVLPSSSSLVPPSSSSSLLVPERHREPALPERPPVPAPRLRPPVPAPRQRPPVPAPRQRPPVAAPRKLTHASPLVPSGSPSFPLVPSSSTLPERPRDAALPERPRDAALPERPRDAALPERPRDATLPERPPVPAPRQPPPVSAPRQPPPVPALPGSPEPLPAPSGSPEPLPVPSGSPEPLPAPSGSPEPLPAPSGSPEPLPVTSGSPEPRATAPPEHPPEKSFPNKIFGGGGLPTMEASQAPRSAMAAGIPGSAIPTMEASRGPRSALASRAPPPRHGRPSPATPPWPPELPAPPMAAWAPRSAMAAWAPRSTMAAGIPGSAMAAWSAIGPGTGTALEATCPVSQSLRPPERPPPLPFRCHTARDAPIGRGGGGNVRLCLPLPLFPCPYMVLPVSQSLLVQSVSAVCLDYVPGVSSYVSLYIVCSAPCYLWIIVNVMCQACLDILPRVPVSPPFVIH